MFLLESCQFLLKYFSSSLVMILKGASTLLPANLTLSQYCPGSIFFPSGNLKNSRPKDARWDANLELVPHEIFRAFRRVAEEDHRKP